MQSKILEVIDCKDYSDPADDDSDDPNTCSLWNGELNKSNALHSVNFQVLSPNTCVGKGCVFLY